jgi:hypothetical protein
MILTKTNRRNFLGLLTVSGMGLTAVPVLQAQESGVTESPLADSPPVLQCPSETGITVVWAVGQPATGCLRTSAPFLF